MDIDRIFSDVMNEILKSLTEKSGYNRWAL